MADTGIIYRRNSKANLIANPPIVGEIVFALDTEEYGAIESGTLIWRKHSASGEYLNLSGGTLNGNLTLANDPTIDLHAATKKYVDDILVIDTTNLNNAVLAAQTAQGLAETAQADAETAETNAQNSETMAQEWSEKTEDVEITGNPGKYSSLHHAAKSEASKDIVVAKEALVSPHYNAIDTVSGISADVTTVAGINGNVTSVASNEINVTTVATNIANVNLVGTDITNVNTTATDITNVNTVATNIADVNTTATNINDIITVANDLNEPLSEIDTVATNITNVNLVGTDITNVNTVATDIINVNTVATNITDVNTTATNIADIVTVANDLNEPLSEIDTVATNITNVNLVGADITNVNTTAGSIANVNTTATNIGDVNTTATNIADIITVANDLNEPLSEIETVAGSIANVDLVGTDITNVNTVATNIANVNTTATDIANVNTTAGSIANVNTTATNIGDVNTTATNILDVSKVADDITNVVTVANDLNEPLSEINTVAVDIANVNLVGNDIANVNTTATNIANVNTTATNITNVNTTATNIASVNTTATNIADINTLANTTNLNNINTLAGVQNLADITTVADDLNAVDINGIADITIVADDLVLGVNSNIIKVSTDITDVTTVAGNLNGTDTIGVVATDLNLGLSSNVNIVGTDIDNVNATGADIANVNTVAGNLTTTDTIGTVSGSIANVNTVGTNIADVNTVAINIADINVVDTNIADIITVANDLNEPQSEIDTVATNIVNVNLVGADIANVNTTATNIGDVNTVATDISNVNTVSTDILDVSTVADNLNSVIYETNTKNAIEVLASNDANITTVAGISGNVTTVATNDTNVTTVATDITNVNTTATNISNVNTVAGVSGNVTTVATDIANVNTVANDLNEGVSEINTVAVSIANVDTVGTNISNVNTVAGNLNGTDTISTVATNIANVNLTGGSIANVNLTGGSIANVNTVADELNDLAYTGNTENSIDVVAGNTIDISKVAAIDTNVTTVAGIDTNVTTVAGISGNVTTVAGVSANVTTTALNIANVNTVATDIINVNAVASNETNIDTVAGISANVTTVAGISTNVSTVATDISNVNTVADELNTLIYNTNTENSINLLATNLDGTDTIGTVAGSISNVNTTADNISNVNTVSTNIANVNTVAGIDIDVSTVATNNANVTTVATNNANVTTVATDITNINSVATQVVPNMAEILLVDDRAAQVTLDAADTAQDVIDTNTYKNQALAALQNTVDIFDTFDDIFLGAKQVTSKTLVFNGVDETANITLYKKVQGTVSNATGWVASSSFGTNTEIVLENVTGTFQTLEDINVLDDIGTILGTTGSGIDVINNNADTEPSLDNDGNVLLPGTIYYNIATEEVKFYNSVSWDAPDTAAATSAQNAQVSELNSEDSNLEAEDWANKTTGVVNTYTDGVENSDGTEFSAKKYAQDAASDAAQTALDLIATNQDTIDTAADLALTNADVVLTNADVTSSGTNATNAQLRAWEAEAEKMTADSYATEAEDVNVISYTSDGDGTFTGTPTAEFSALHYKNKAEALTSGSITNASDVDTTGAIGNDILAYNGVDTWVPKDLTELGILEDSDIGTNVQAYDANIVSDATYVATEENYTTVEKTKLSTVEQRVNHTGTQDMSTVINSNIIGNPTDIDSLDNIFTHMYSSGVADGGALTDNLNGTIDIATCQTFLRATGGTSHDPIYSVVVPATTVAITLTDNAANYVYAEYNSGTPQYGVTTNPGTINMLDRVPLYVIVREGTKLTTIDSREQNVDHIGKNQIKDFYTETFKRKNGGMIVSDAGTKHLACTSGAFYFQLNEYPIPALDTTGVDTFEYYYRDGIGGWNESDASIIDSANYDDGTGTLNTLTNNRYATHWIYIIVGDNPHYAVVYSQDQYNNVATAQAANPPAALPPSIQNLGVLIGRAIVQETSAELYSVETTFGTTFATSTATEHNELAGIQGGAVGDFYHLTTAQVAIVDATSGTNTGDQVSSDFTHDSLTGVNADEHIDWTLTNAKNIHPDNYTDTTYLPADPGTNGTDGTDGLLTDADKFKLDNIETGATADQTKTDIESLNINASSLTEDANNRLVTDTEKSTWNGKQDTLTFDAVPTDTSTNPVESNGVFDALATKEPTFSKNTAFNKNFGSTTGTVCEGDDSRLSDARTPTSHTHLTSEVTGLDTALGNKLETSLKGANNGLAELDANGFVPSAQLPSFVDDVLEYANLAAFPATGETGKVYIAIDTNITYRWSGSVYVPIGSDLALGETSTTAYRGDRGKAAYDHSLVTTGNPHNVTATDVSLGNVTNESKATMFTNPTFTGTVGGVTATHVGLGNVVNTDTTNADNISDGTTNAIITLTQETNFETAFTNTHTHDQTTDINAKDIFLNSKGSIQSLSTTLTTVTETPLNLFLSASYGTAKIIVQANDTVTGNRHSSELMITHDGTTASAVEYGTIFTGTSLATFDVDINTGTVRLLITGASTNNTVYTVINTLII